MSHFRWEWVWDSRDTWDGWDRWDRGELAGAAGGVLQAVNGAARQVQHIRDGADGVALAGEVRDFVGGVRGQGSVVPALRAERGRDGEGGGRQGAAVLLQVEFEGEAPALFP